MPRKPRILALVLGDQLEPDSSLLRDLDPERDAIWMAETQTEASHVPAHKLRLALFFSAMRHYRDQARERGWSVHYHELGVDSRQDEGKDFRELLQRQGKQLAAQRWVVTEPGDWRVTQMLAGAADDVGVDLEIRRDDHFLCGIDEFARWADGRKEFVLEHFYRWMRKRERILLEDDEPTGGKWNYDDENRESFGKDGPVDVKAPRRFRTDPVTDKVIAMVEKRFADHPGSLDQFDFPVTRAQALAALRDFIEYRLATFGTHQDAMWHEEPFLSHSRLSAPLNLKLLNPRECIEKAIAAYESGKAPLNSVEGFVRQVLGWREFVRGIYWLHMPGYAQKNELECDPERDVPSFFWDGSTDMACVADAMRGVVDHAYAHHIARLMVLGLFAQMSGIHPLRFHEWHMAMYADAIDWVSLPNTLGMSQYGDGGIVGSKPYCATGRYIQRMGPYCKGCRYDPTEATGARACPFTTFYWDFLDRHHERLRGNRRMTFQIRNLERKSDEQLQAIRDHAEDLRDRIARGTRI